MDDIDVKICVSFNTEKRIENFYKKYSECNACNIERVSRRYYNNRDEILQKRRHQYARFKDLDNRLTALEEKL